MEKLYPAKSSLQSVSELLHHACRQCKPRSPKQVLSILHCSPSIYKKSYGLSNKPLSLIFIKAHDKLMHVTSRWPFIGSEIIPFGPQTHQLLGTGGVIQQPTDRQILPHPSNVLNIKSREDTDLCNDREAELQLWTLLRNKNLPIPCTIYLFTTSTTVSATQSQHLLFNSRSLYT